MYKYEIHKGDNVDLAIHDNCTCIDLSIPITEVKKVASVFKANLNDKGKEITQYSSRILGFSIHLYSMTRYNKCIKIDTNSVLTYSNIPIDISNSIGDKLLEVLSEESADYYYKE